MQARQETNIQAYNLAFESLGLSWQWDEDARIEPGPEGLREYLEREHPHLLRAYDADFLVQAIETARSRYESTQR